jgi:hypothetical protein
MWCVKLSDPERDALRALLKSLPPQGPDGEPHPTVEAVLEALELARWDDLPEASLPWDHVAELAGRQNIGEADVVWDLAAGMVTAPPQRPAR